MTTPQITVYAANCIGNAANCLYPNEITITDKKSAKAAFSHDTVYAKYKNNYRSIQNFLYAEAVPMDCDNSHSDNEAEWISENDIAEMFPDVAYVIHFSRHNMKSKDGKSPRPKFHVIFQTSRTDDVSYYGELKEKIIAMYPFFDVKAKDTAHFLFGTKDPQILIHPGNICIRRHPLSDIVEVGCKQCGKKIVQIKGRKGKQFCSDRCRNAWWNAHPEHIRKKAFYHLTCEYCGKEFESYGNKNRKYCSRVCYANARRTHTV